MLRNYKPVVDLEIELKNVGIDVYKIIEQTNLLSDEDYNLCIEMCLSQCKIYGIFETIQLFVSDKIMSDRKWIIFWVNTINSFNVYRNHFKNNLLNGNQTEN
jgi:hypothetical protein